MVDRLEVRGRINHQGVRRAVRADDGALQHPGRHERRRSRADARLRDLLGVGIDAVKAATSLPQPEPPPYASPSVATVVSWALSPLGFGTTQTSAPASASG